MFSKNIVLIGFMGAGKTLVSRSLEKKTGLACLSTDTMVEDRAGKTINDIFAEGGEELFRQLESDVVKDVSARTDAIIDCGGGVVLNPRNVTELKRNGLIFYLDSPPELIYERIKRHTHRPLLQTPDPLKTITDLFEKRLPFYSQADFTVDTAQQSIEEAADEIIGIMQSKGTGSGSRP